MGAAMLAMAAGLHLKQLASLSSTIAITGTVAYMVFFALALAQCLGSSCPRSPLPGCAVSAHPIMSHTCSKCCCICKIP